MFNACIYIVGGKTRAIPILLQRGANIGIKDNSSKTPLDLASNDRARELIIVYSAPPYKVSKDDEKWMDNAIRGDKTII